MKRPSNRFLQCIAGRRPRPLVIAHRGDSGIAPENTLEALESGHASGADACEIDVQLSGDGVAFVVHDESLRRTTDVASRYGSDPRARAGFRVRDFSSAEVESLDAGSWFLDGAAAHRSAGFFGTTGRIETHRVLRFRSGTVRVPRLAEVLDLVRGHDWLVNVEIKSYEKGSCRDLLGAVLNDVARSGVADRVLVSSFDHRIVAEAAASALPLATGVLTNVPIPDPGPYVRETVGADVYHPSVKALGGAVVEGVPVLVYTVNDPAPGGLAESLALRPVDGLFTDDPAALLARFAAVPWRLTGS